MHVIKKIGLIASAFLLGPMILLSVFSVAFRSTAGDKEYVKKGFSEAGVYAAVGDALVQSAVGEGEGDALVEKALKSAVDETAMQQAVEPVIDSLYAWLEGDIKNPEFSLNLRTIEKSFEESLTKLLKKQAASLPDCAPGTLPSTTDVLSIECIPEGFDTNERIQDAVEGIIARADIFSDATTKDGSLSQQEINDLGIKTPAENLSTTIPTTYRVFNQGFWFFVGTALLSIAGLIFLSISKLRGLRKIGIILLSNGILLIVIAGILQFILGSLIPSASVSATEAPISAIENVAKTLISDVARIVRIGAISTVILGGTSIVVSTIFIRKHRAIPNSPAISAPKKMDDSDFSQ